MLKVVMSLIVTIFCFSSGCPATAQSSHEKKTFESCISQITAALESMSSGPYSDFADSIIDYDRLIAIAGADPKVQRQQKVKALRSSIVIRTIPQVKNHSLTKFTGRINYRPYRYKGQQIGWLMNGKAQDVEVQLGVSLGGKYGCMIFDAKAITNYSLKNLARDELK